MQLTVKCVTSGLGEATDFERHLLLLQQHFTGIQSFVYVTYIHKRSKKIILILTALNPCFSFYGGLIEYCQSQSLKRLSLSRDFMAQAF